MGETITQSHLHPSYPPFCPKTSKSQSRKESTGTEFLLLNHDVVDSPLERKMSCTDLWCWFVPNRLLRCVRCFSLFFFALEHALIGVCHVFVTHGRAM
eukprot:TRINITY_DN2495_c0_g1_i11.p1 TRINITY_DN2495_c0_g1~~TRINITY_DN2495_c0_g1_i11.p1  ORF type:complete len:108 (-),score=11.29 TRINITY_DN2495_c0_g1_i11:312-605(-)